MSIWGHLHLVNRSTGDWYNHNYFEGRFTRGIRFCIPSGCGICAGRPTASTGGLLDRCRD